MSTEQADRQSTLSKDETNMSVTKAAEDVPGHKVALIEELSGSLEAVLGKMAEAAGVPPEVTEGLTGVEGATVFVDQMLEADKAKQDDLLNVLTQLDMPSASQSLKALLQEKSKEDTNLKEETNIIEEKKESVKAEEEAARPYKEVLSESSGTFVDCLLIPNDLLEHLQKNSVLSLDMITKIRCRPNRPDKVRVLLSFLMNLGPESLLSFIAALRATDQNFLANILAANSFK